MMRESSVQRIHKRRQLAFLTVLWAVQSSEAFVPSQNHHERRPHVLTSDLSRHRSSLRQRIQPALLYATAGKATNGNVTSINSNLHREVAAPNGEETTSDVTPNEAALQEDPSLEVPTSLREVDVLYGRSHGLLYDPLQERFVKQSEQRDKTENWSPGHFVRHNVLPLLSVALRPQRP